MNTIDNKEYKPGLASYGGVGKEGNSGNSGNKLFFVNENLDSQNIIIDSSATNNDFVLSGNGFIYNISSKRKNQKIGNILNYVLDLDKYYIDKHCPDGKIYFNIQKTEIESGYSYELRNKYTNEIKTIDNYE